MMKWAWVTLWMMAVALGCSAQFTIPMGGTPSSGDSPKLTRSTTRTLTGTVLNKSDKPVSNAVVYLKNSKTLAIRTYIAQQDGTYRFPELSPNVDYEIYAQKEGTKSSTKTISQFDDRQKPTLNLVIDVNK